MKPPQQIADELLAQHHAARLKIAITRSEQLYNFYVAERQAGVDALTANQRMHEHAKWLDELELVNKEMEKAS